MKIGRSGEEALLVEYTLGEPQIVLLHEVSPEKLVPAASEQRTFAHEEVEPFFGRVYLHEPVLLAALGGRVVFFGTHEGLLREIVHYIRVILSRHTVDLFEAVRQDPVVGIKISDIFGSTVFPRDIPRSPLHDILLQGYDYDVFGILHLPQQELAQSGILRSIVYQDDLQVLQTDGLLLEGLHASVYEHGDIVAGDDHAYLLLSHILPP